MAFATVQTKGAASVSGAAITVTPDAGFTAGNAAHIGIVYYQSGNTPLSILTVTDQAINSLTFDQASTQRFATDTGLNTLSVRNLPSSVTSIIVTLSGVPVFGSNYIMEEYSGLTATGTDGGNSTSASATTATDNATSGTASNASQPAGVFGISTDSAFNSIPAAGTGFTSNLGANALRIEYKRVTATGSQAATFTNTHGSSCNHISAMVIIDEPGGGGGGSLLTRPRGLGGGAQGLSGGMNS